MIKKFFKRNVLLRMNRYQFTIVLPIIIALVMIQGLLGALYYLLENQLIVFLEEIHSATLIYHQAIITLKQYVPMIISFVSILVFFHVYWFFYASNKILGPHERIIKELDQIITGKSERKTLSARKNDQLFEELLNRINILIEHSQFDKRP